MIELKTFILIWQHIVFTTFTEKKIFGPDPFQDEANESEELAFEREGHRAICIEGRGSLLRGSWVTSGTED